MLISVRFRARDLYAVLSMNFPAAIIILVLLLFGPLAVHFIEENIEAYIFIIGIVATLIGSGFNSQLVLKAAEEPIMITIAVVVAGVLFGFTRERLDGLFARLRRRVGRPVLAAVSIFILAILSGVITAIIAALVLVEMVGLLRLDDQRRTRVTVAACFAIGLGAALTRVGEPLSALAASALQLPFMGLFYLLGPWILPGVAAASLLVGFFARGDYQEAASRSSVHETPLTAILQAVKVYVFVAGLVLVSNAYGAIAARVVDALSNDALFWLNTVSAALDNATLVALEVHNMTLPRAREAIIALLVSGGMLIPGNIPNIVSAGALRISSTAWARIGIPIGLVGLGIYFALLKFLA
jgi:predicted cation transporter